MDMMYLSEHYGAYQYPHPGDYTAGPYKAEYPKQGIEYPGPRACSYEGVPNHYMHMAPYTYEDLAAVARVNAYNKGKSSRAKGNVQAIFHRLIIQQPIRTMWLNQSTLLFERSAEFLIRLHAGVNRIAALPFGSTST